MLKLPTDLHNIFPLLVWQYARAVLSFAVTLSLVLGAAVGALMVDWASVNPDWSFKAITYFLLGKLPSCLVAFFLLLRLTFVARFQTQMQTQESLEDQLRHPLRHMAASVWVAVMGWELAMAGGLLGLLVGLLAVDAAEVHLVWAYLSLDYDMTVAVRGLLRTVCHAAVLSWLLYLESVVMSYWQSDKEMRMTQFIFLGLLALVAIEVLDTVMFLN